MAATFVAAIAVYMKEGLIVLRLYFKIAFGM